MVTKKKLEADLAAANEALEAEKQKAAAKVHAPAAAPDVDPPGRGPQVIDVERRQG